MATSTQQAGRSVPLEQIHVPDNVRDLDKGHVQALARSIALQGMLVPVAVRAAGARPALEHLGGLGVAVRLA